MKYLLFLGFLCVGCYQPQRNCTDFRKGTFEFETIIGNKTKKSTFIRKNNIEIEYFENKVDSSSIRWINDCEYILKKINPKNMAEQKSIHIKILNTTKNSYQFEYGIVGSNKKRKGMVIKIK